MRHGTTTLFRWCTEPGWYSAPVVFARNDGNLTRMEVLLGIGEMAGVLKVLVNGVEIPAGIAGTNMTGTGWYNIPTLGTRTGTFNPDFTDGSGQPAGDPYGSMAYLSVVVPNRLNDGTSLRRQSAGARLEVAAVRNGRGCDRGAVQQQSGLDPAGHLAASGLEHIRNRYPKLRALRRHIATRRSTHWIFTGTPSACQDLSVT